VTSTPSQKRRLRLIRQLQAAHELLRAWDTSLRAASVSAPGSISNGLSEAAVLLAIVNEAREGLNRRLIELGVGDFIPPVDSPKEGVQMARPPRVPVEPISLVSVCVNACRACGRALGAAFREAQTVADAASARILYGSIRALEKQLWVLDPCQAY
jgi:hypothetical protein